MNHLAPIRNVRNPNGPGLETVTLTDTSWTRLDPRSATGGDGRIFLSIRNGGSSPIEVCRTMSDTPPSNGVTVGNAQVAANNILTGWYTETVRHWARSTSGAGAALVQEGY